MLGLELLDRRPKALSGGQRQRVAMGRAIVRSPRCSCSTSRCRTSTPSCASRCARDREAAAAPRTTMVYVTHDQVEAMTMADRSR
jgi:multiple sugar transport system ATP-binding protein